MSRKILLGVTGGIAAYKSADLVRRLRERDCDVQVVMTAGAERFVSALTFQAVSGRPVRSSLLDPAAEAAMGHIELARWADLVLVAPATADFLARYAQGMADDLLTTLLLATAAPVAVAPAMNQQMWQHPATVFNVALLQQRGVAVWGPGAGDQACGEFGPGRMLEPLDLAQRVVEAPRDVVLAGKSVLITAGPTREPVDPVRFLTNRSSGKMGYAIAQACRQAGAIVTLVSGPVSLSAPSGVTRVAVETAAEMEAAVNAALPDADIFIAAAAVADYRPAEVAVHKIKKNDAEMAIALVRTPDILAQASRGNPQLFTVGFAAETQDIERNARAKLARKNLDLVCANEVGAGLGFEVDDNRLQVYWPGGQQTLGPSSKLAIAHELVDLIAVRCQARPPVAAGQ